MKKGHALNASKWPLSSNKDQVKNSTVERQHTFEGEDYEYQKL